MNNDVTGVRYTYVKPKIDHKKYQLPEHLVSYNKNDDVTGLR